jgi:hypothetical protein
MDTHKTALERAFDIARSGGCISVADLIKRLKYEGYESHQIEGAHLRKQLVRLITGQRAVITKPSPKKRGDVVTKLKAIAKMSPEGRNIFFRAVRRGRGRRRV